MHGARIHAIRQDVRLAWPEAGWHACACIIDRSFVVIRLKHLAV
ncbi:MAG: hypothetical protein OJF58_002837 [Enhydrobacter sp.]|jgi:hypothetical protein|nr:MAG: hypothetical protein OJF58_002837 [Enhydrobacter sp.]